MGFAPFRLSFCFPRLYCREAAKARYPLCEALTGADKGCVVEYMLVASAFRGLELSRLIERAVAYDTTAMLFDGAVTSGDVRGEGDTSLAVRWRTVVSQAGGGPGAALERCIAGALYRCSGGALERSSARPLSWHLCYCSPLPALVPTVSFGAVWRRATGRAACRWAAAAH